jgi:hypothetical protein
VLVQILDLAARQLFDAVGRGTKIDLNADEVTLDQIRLPRRRRECDIGLRTRDRVASTTGVTWISG